MSMTECCYILRITYANTTFGDTSSTIPFSVSILYLGEPTIAMVSWEVGCHSTTLIGYGNTKNLLYIRLWCRGLLGLLEHAREAWACPKSQWAVHEGCHVDKVMDQFMLEVLWHCSIPWLTWDVPHTSEYPRSYISYWGIQVATNPRYTKTWCKVGQWRGHEDMHKYWLVPVTIHL